MPVNTLFAGIFIFAKQQKFQKYSRMQSRNRGNLTFQKKVATINRLNNCTSTS